MANDLTGQVFSRLTVLRKNGKAKYGQSLWECKCECGNTKTIIGSNLLRGLTKSCGCLNIELTLSRNLTHGLRYHVLYSVWTNIKTRCYNRNSDHYKDYGGRGIVMCDRWLIFDNFYNDVIDSYKEGLTLDRYLNNDGNYEPTNFRWATIGEQNRNTRKNVYLVYNGVTKTQSELSRELGVSQHFIIYWLRKGLSMNDIAFKSKQKIA